MKDKKEICRREAKKHRDFIDPASENPEAAIDHFFEFIQPRKDQIIAGYCAKGREFDPYPIIEALQRSGVQTALPVVEAGSRLLRFAFWKEGEPLVRGPFEILQPEINEDTRWAVPDIVMVPFLAFDRRGYRLGYGGGYYDTTLKALRRDKDILAVGIGYAQQAVLFNLPTESHDEPLDAVITPKGIHKFTEGMKTA